MPLGLNENNEVIMRHLNRREVVEVREYYFRGHTIRGIAAAYFTSEQTISDAVHNRTHKRVRLGKGEKLDLPELEDMAHRNQLRREQLLDPEGYEERRTQRRQHLVNNLSRRGPQSNVKQGGARFGRPT